MGPQPPPLDVDPDALTFDQEVEYTMAATGETDEAVGEFMVAIRRGEVTGDTEELPA